MAVILSSRYPTLMFSSQLILWLAAPVHHCNAFIFATACCFAVAIPSTSALFFFRLKAVYCNDRIATGIFAFLLCALFGLCFMAPAAVKGRHIGTTQRCIITEVGTRASMPLILNAFIDTLVFIAISLRIISFSIK